MTLVESSVPELGVQVVGGYLCNNLGSLPAFLLKMGQGFFGLVWFFPPVSVIWLCLRALTHGWRQQTGGGTSPGNLFLLVGSFFLLKKSPSK